MFAADQRTAYLSNCNDKRIRLCGRLKGLGIISRPEIAFQNLGVKTVIGMGLTRSRKTS